MKRINLSVAHTRMFDFALRFSPGVGAGRTMEMARGRSSHDVKFCVATISIVVDVLPVMVVSLSRT